MKKINELTIDVRRVSLTGDVTDEQAKGLRTISEPTVVYEQESQLFENARTIGVYVDTQVSPSVERVPCKLGSRTNGIVTNSATVGTLSRNVIRGDYCTYSKLCETHPDEFRSVELVAPKLERDYREHWPERYRHHKNHTKEFAREWRFSGGVFTTATINKDSPIGWHHDKGNTPDCPAACLFVSRGVTGGFLCVPEWGLKFEPRNGFALLFDGVKWLHGVSPFAVADGGVRISVVYYTFRDVWRCLPPQEELRNYQRTKTRRERALIGRDYYDGVKPEIKGNDDSGGLFDQSR